MKFGVLKEEKIIRSIGGFVLGEYPKGQRVRITEGNTFGGAHTITADPCDIIGNPFGSHSFYIKNPEGVEYDIVEEKEPTDLELTYAAICEAKERMEVMAYHAREES